MKEPRITQFTLQRLGVGLPCRMNKRAAVGATAVFLQQVLRLLSQRLQKMFAVSMVLDRHDIKCLWYLMSGGINTCAIIQTFLQLVDVSPHTH